MHSTRLIAVFLLACTLMPVFAYADDSPRDVQAADASFQSARAALDRGDLGVACAQFAESQRLDPAPGTLLNLGECEERRGKLATAYGHFVEARASLAADDFRIPFAEARIAHLVGRLPRLTLALAAPPVPGATVLCDEREILSSSLGAAFAVDPGAHVCVLRAPDHVDGRTEVTVKEGETLRVELMAGPSTPVGDAVGVAGRRNDAGLRRAPVSHWGAQRIAGVVAGSLGAVGLVTGTVLGFVAKGTYDDAVRDCPLGTTKCGSAGVTSGQSADAQARASTTAFVVGGILVGGGAALFLTAPRAGHLAVVPAVGSRGPGLSVLGDW